MLKKLTHPNHGVHFVYTTAEYETCLKNGWKDVPEEAIKPKVVEKAPEPEPQKASNAPKPEPEPPKKRRGRPRKDKSWRPQQL